MATDKNKISAYLSDEDFKTLKALSAQYQVSSSQVVALAIRALSSQDNVTPLAPLPVPLTSGVSKQDIESLINKKVESFESAIASLRSELMEEIEKKSELVAA